MIHVFIARLYGEVFYKMLGIAFSFYPIWLPLLLIALFVELYMKWRRITFVMNQGSVLLEIKVPRELAKSPEAMEVVITSLYQTGAASYAESYVDGKVRPWFSMEMASFGGDVHLYIWAQKKFKTLLEAQIYAQYPGVEVTEVPDYTKNFVFDPKKYIIWGTYFILSKPSAFPIKTYVDYKMDENPKEEYKIDPMTSVLEYLSSIGKGEQIWIQILFQAHKKEGLKEGRLKKRRFWNDATNNIKVEDMAPPDIIKKMRTDLADKENPNKPERRPTKGETDIIAAIERKVSKLPFETIIRGFYIAETEKFNSIHITGLIGSVRQYNSNNMNGFKLGKFTDHDDNVKDFFRFFFKKTGENIRRRMERSLLNAYRMRSFFQYPFKNYRGKAYILNTEELATIFHFPGEVAATPGLNRIQSKRGQAPTNLPT